MTARAVMGDAPKRREDQRFLTGQGRYLDDLAFPGAARAVLLRSPHAHAIIRRVDTAAARALPGVLAALTHADLAADGLLPMRPTVEANVQLGEPFTFEPQPLLAAGRVRHVGEPVALIVAETLNQALDAQKAVTVDYEPLPAVTTIAAARSRGAPGLSAHVANNTCLDWEWGGHAGAEHAFARATHHVTMAMRNHRLVTNPMEPRGVVGAWDAPPSATPRMCRARTSTATATPPPAR